MLIIGSHVSFKKDTQLLGSLKEALSYKENTFMFYTGAPQNTNRLPINDNLTKEALIMMEENNIDKNNIIVHAPYIVNLANSDKLDYSISFLIEECKRCESLSMNKLVLHPGSHVGLGVNVGINNIIYGLNKILANTNVIILLETMAGKGTEIGSNFNELKQIIDNIEYKDKIGICLDTCHLSDSGYDLSSFDNILNELDRLDLFKYIKCIHINDSKNSINSKKDRHENIGFGYIGFNNLINIIYNKRLENIPKILESPYINEYPPYKFEIDMIRNKKFNENLSKDVEDYYIKNGIY
jgi:deoxyribonuclease IV